MRGGQTKNYSAETMPTNEFARGKIQPAKHMSERFALFICAAEYFPEHMHNGTYALLQICETDFISMPPYQIDDTAALLCCTNITLRAGLKRLCVRTRAICPFSNR